MRLGIAACLLVVLLPGCGSPIAVQDPVTIVFVHPDSDTRHYEALAESLAGRYLEIAVQLRPTAWHLLDSAFVGGERDVGVFHPILQCPLYPERCQSSPAELWAKGEVLGLTPFVEQDGTFDREDFFPGLLDLDSEGSETLAVPAGVDPVVMYLNRDVLASAGVAEPGPDWTWDDSLSLATAVRDAGPDVFGYSPTDELLDAIVITHQLGCQLFDDISAPTLATLDWPENIIALTWYVDPFHTYDVTPTHKEVASDSFGGTLQAGIYLDRTAVWAGWLSGPGSAPAAGLGAARAHWSVLPLPRTGHSNALVRAGGCFASAQTEHPDACWTWVSCLTEQLPPAGLFPSRRSVAQSPVFAAAAGDEFTEVGWASMDSPVLLTPGLQSIERVLWALRQAVERALGGTATPEEALSWAQAASTALIQNLSPGPEIATQCGRAAVSTLPLRRQAESQPY
jgi:ABC-type glycerol-3-phosphate transport system substrate-binding protein